MACNMLVRGLDGKTSCLRFSSSIITGSLLRERISAIFCIPVDTLLIFTGTRAISPSSLLSAGEDCVFPSCSVLLRLRAGKGGFGSLLRGAATKAGQKKTSNFDACRDMSGRRLRHVNAEKKLKEWKANANERELEKAANEFLKKQVKQKKDDSGCLEVMVKFREDTSRAREEVESAVARGLAEAKKFGKRKVVEEEPASSSKRARIWESSEIDMIEEGSEDDEDGSEDEKVEEASEDDSIDDESDDGKARQDSQGSSEDEATEVRSEDGKDNERSNDKGSYDNAKGKDRFESESSEKISEEENTDRFTDNDTVVKVAEVVECNGHHYCSSTASICVDVHVNKHQSEVSEGSNNLKTNGAATNDNTTCHENLPADEQQNLNFADFVSASDMEVLGLERLKQELQIRGLKCGGSLAERAHRLFLLKTIPLEKLDKKHFAKARG